MIFLGSGTMAFGQAVPPDTTKMTDVQLGHYYLDKSKKQKTVGFILLGAGLAGLIGGSLVSIDSESFGGISEDAGEGRVIMFLGLGCTVASIPLLISGVKNKGRAEILLRNENVPLGRIPGVSPTYPAIGVRIPLGRK